MTNREQAVKDFMAHNAMEENLAGLFKAVASQNPTVVMVIWENDEGYGAVTMPRSNAFAYDLIVGVDDVSDDEPSDSESMD